MCTMAFCSKEDCSLTCKIRNPSRIVCCHPREKKIYFPEIDFINSQYAKAGNQDSVQMGSTDYKVRDKFLPKKGKALSGRRNKRRK